jgi:hypothetical protein
MIAGFVLDGHVLQEDPPDNIMPLEDILHWMSFSWGSLCSVMKHGKGVIPFLLLLFLLLNLIFNYGLGKKKSHPHQSKLSIAKYKITV